MASRSPLVLIGGEKQQLDSVSDYIATGALPTLTLADTNASHTLNLTAGSNLTNNRTFTITTGDANRTLTLSADLTVSGTTTVNGTFSGTSSGTNTGDALFDGLSAPAQADESVTGTATLSTSARGKMHAVTGASDYTITLPAAGTAGYKIGFSFRQNAANLVRLTGVAMGGLSDRYYITGESLVLRSNGSTYDVESEGLCKPWFKATRTSNLSVTDATWVTAQYNVDTNADPYSLYDTSTYVFTANRPGRWAFMHFFLGGPDSAGLTVVGGGIRVNTTSGVPVIVQTTNWANTSSRRILCHGDVILAKGNTWQPACYVDHTSGNILDYTESYFQANWLGHD